MNCKTQALTKAMCNLGNMVTLRFIALNENCGKLKVKNFEIPHCTYTEPLGARLKELNQ